MKQQVLKGARSNLLALCALVFLVVAGTQAWAAKVYRIGVDGLACPFCAYGIEKHLKALPGVKNLRISVNAGTVTVTMRDGATLSKDVANRIIKEAGFTMRSFR